MITPDQIKVAYEELLAKDEAQYQAEEKRIEAVEKREDAYQKAMEDARSDGIMDEGKIHQKAQKATRKQLTALHVAEKAIRRASHEYRQAGITVDGLNKQVEAAKVALQK
jgi:hypothetical protein